MSSQPQEFVPSLFEATHNTRDLGGHRTEEGREVRRGMIFRSDALVGLTEQDAATLRGLGLRSVVDLRMKAEIDRLGANEVTAGIRVHEWPMIDESGDTLSAALTHAFEEEALSEIERLLGDGAAETMLLNSAINFCTQPVPLSRFGQMLRLLADDGAPVLYNCRAGKDRTGFMTAVVLRTLGVSEADVTADYVASNHYLVDRTHEVISRLTGAGVREELISPLMEQQASVMEAFFVAVDERYGSWQGFLEQALGVDEQTVAKLHEHLLD